MNQTQNSWILDAGGFHWHELQRTLFVASLSSLGSPDATRQAHREEGSYQAVLEVHRQSPVTGGQTSPASRGIWLLESQPDVEKQKWSSGLGGRLGAR